MSAGYQSWESPTRNRRLIWSTGRTCLSVIIQDSPVQHSLQVNQLVSIQNHKKHGSPEVSTYVWSWVIKQHCHFRLIVCIYNSSNYAQAVDQPTMLYNVGQYHGLEVPYALPLY